MDKIYLREKFPISKKRFWKKITTNFIAKSIFITIFLAIAGFIAGGQRDIPSEMRPLTWLVIFFRSFAGLVALDFFYRFFWFTQTYINKCIYYGDESFITIKKGVFTPSEIHIQYKKIQEVNISQTSFDRMFGIYNIQISSVTGDSGDGASINGMKKENAEGLKQFLLNKININNN